MNSSFTAKAISLFLAASVSAVCLTACGGGSESSSKSAKESRSSAADTTAAAAEEKNITGETKSWGVFTVLVPEGWTLREGDALDATDPNYCSVKKSDFTYFDLKSEKDDLMKQHYEYNKNTYTDQQKDLPATKVGNFEWNGFEYGGDFNKGFELYATADGKNIRVSCCGFRFDSAEAQAILSSITVK